MYNKRTLSSYELFNCHKISHITLTSLTFYSENKAIEQNACVNCGECRDLTSLSDMSTSLQLENGLLFFEFDEIDEQNSWYFTGDDDHLFD